MSPKIDYAVMELPLNQLAHSGHVFDRCSVAVCTHIGSEKPQFGWETPETLAELFSTVLEHARNGIVINADDEHWRLLLKGKTNQKVCLTSQCQSFETLKSIAVPNACFCVIQNVSDQAHVVVHDEGRTIKILPVSEIAAVINSSVDIRLDSIVQAIATAHLMKIGLKAIVAALTDNMEETLAGEKYPKSDR